MLNCETNPIFIDKIILIEILFHGLMFFFSVASKIKISEVPDKPKATYFRKSAFLTTGDSSFKFNFILPSEAADNGNSSNSDTKTVDNSNDSAPNETVNKISNGGNIEQKTDSLNSENAGKGDGKNFKFCFTSSEFKFNFDIQK